MRPAADLVGADRSSRRARHRLEHLEMVDADGIAALVRLGVAASVQPAFDAALGRRRRHVRRAAGRASAP